MRPLRSCVYACVCVCVCVYGVGVCGVGVCVCVVCVGRSLHNNYKSLVQV